MKQTLHDHADETATQSDAPSMDAVFSPVRSQPAFEETVERLGTAIKLGLLVPGTRLPAERELCARLGIARSTLRQALTALSQSGHIVASRGRGGGTFVANPPPPPTPPHPGTLACWRDTCDRRLAVELGVAALAAERAGRQDLRVLEDLAGTLEMTIDDFPAYRKADVRFHVALAEATGSAALVRSMTEVQGAMSDLISYIAHPPEVLVASNAQHQRMLAALHQRDAMRAVRAAHEHLRATEHILAGLLPSA